HARYRRRHGRLETLACARSAAGGAEIPVRDRVGFRRVETRERRAAMKSDNVNLFRTLEPPPGGVERFRRRLEAADAATRQPSASRIVSAGLAAALVAVVVIALDQAPSSSDLPPEVGAET